MEPAKGLIFLILAVQLKGIPRQIVQRIGRAWEENPKLHVPHSLEQEGFVTAAERVLLEQLADAAVHACGGDVGKALVYLGGEARLHEIFGDAIPKIDYDELATSPMPPGALPPPVDEPETLLNEAPGRYTQISLHASGGMGRVLLVHDTSTDRNIALKELLPASEGSTHGVDSPVRQMTQMASRFLLEGRITAQLEHPSIVPVYELGRRKNGTLYYTMKLVRGKTLAAAIADAKTLEERLRLLSHFIDLCQAIAFAHDRGVLHRDIKPPNIMVGEFGETVVLDWGVAKVKKEPDMYEEEIRATSSLFGMDEKDWKETAYGTAIGTPHYMPPEQAQGLLDEIDERSDVYALGAVLYEILTGEVPFHGKSAREIITRVVNTEPPAIARYEPDAPPELISICTKAMSKARDKRYPSAKALAEELQKFQSGALVGAYNYTFSEIARRYYRKHKAMVNTVGAAAAAIALVCIFAYINILMARNRERAQRLIAEQEAYLAEIRLADAYMDDYKYDDARRILDETLPEKRDVEWAYLAARASQDIATLDHGAPVTSAQYSPDGKRILTRALPSVILWDAAAFDRLHEWSFGETRIYNCEFSPGGNYVVIALGDATTRVLDAATGEELARIEGHVGPVRNASFSPDEQRLVTAGSDGVVKAWDWRAGKELMAFRGHGSQLQYASFMDDGHTVVSWSIDEDIRLWDAATGAQLAQLDGFRVRPNDALDRFAYIKGNEAIVADARTGAELWRSPVQEGALQHAFISIDNAYVVADSSDGAARVWRLNSEGVADTFSVGEPVWYALLSPDSRRLFTETARGRIDVWDRTSHEKINELSGHGRPTMTLAVSPGGKHVLSASHDGTARIWDAVRPRSYDPVTALARPAMAVAVSPDGKTIASLGLDNTLRVIDAATHRERYRIACQSVLSERSVAFSPDDRFLAVTLDETMPMVFSADTGQFISRFEGHASAVTRLGFSPAGDAVVSVSVDHTVRVWDTPTGEPRELLTGHTETVTAAAFSPDGQRIASASIDNTARIWDGKSGNLVFTLEHPRDVMDVAFSHDGAQVATGCVDGSVRLWDSESGVLVRALPGVSVPVVRLMFTDADKRVLAATNDGSIRVWDTGTGEPYLAMQASSQSLRDLAAVPGSQDLLFASYSGDVRRLRFASLAGPSGETALDAIAGAYKTARTEELEARQAAAAPAVIPVTVVIAPGVLSEALTQLQAAAQNPESASQAGILMSSRTMPAVIARFCFEAGDVIEAVDGVRVRTAGEGVEALAGYSAGQSSGKTPTIVVKRGGQAFEYSFLVQPVVEREREIALTRDEARQLIATARDTALHDAIESILEVNHDALESIGEATPNREALDGLWLIPFFDDEMLGFYRSLDLFPMQRVYTVGARRIDSVDTVYSLLNQADAALSDGGGPWTVTIRVESGQFLKENVVISVK